MTAIFLIYVDSKEKKKKQMLPLSFASCFGEIDKKKIFDMPVLFFEKKSLSRDGTLNGLWNEVAIVKPFGMCLVVLNWNKKTLRDSKYNYPKLKFQTLTQSGLGDVDRYLRFVSQKLKLFFKISLYKSEDTKLTYWIFLVQLRKERTQRTDRGVSLQF